MGGLGNQLFQYAFGQAISDKYGYEVKYDLSYFDNIPAGDELRKPFIHRFLMDSQIATATETELLIRKDKKRLYKVLKQLGLYSYRTRYERPIDGINSIEDIEDNTYLIGYWQSEQYFDNITEKITSTFNFRKLCHDDNIINLAAQMEEASSVSIHIRGGDYLLDKNQAIFGGICTSDYYNKAIEHIKEKVSNPVFYLFTNDIDWTKNNIKLPYDDITIISEQLSNPEDWVELYLMSRCHYNIIANSSYSWWAAWLNQNSDKIVLAPPKWNQNMENDKIYCDSWIKIK